jgi:hypothetical protein
MLLMVYGPPELGNPYKPHRERPPEPMVRPQHEPNVILFVFNPQMLPMEMKQLDKAGKLPEVLPSVTGLLKPNQVSESSPSTDATATGTERAQPGPSASAIPSNLPSMPEPRKLLQRRGRPILRQRLRPLGRLLAVG